MSWMERKFESLGLEVLNCQAPDRSKGVKKGFVTFSLNSQKYQIDYDYAIYLKTEKDILKNAEYVHD